ncbi:hypothetical protein [Sandaracinus amylolyticus]|uniref:hypothetical protein n=1 Tax=Sandaracinus amylolyticus TaxID=927083 RepID=UPI001F225287|nr:hypothetical protein [Sandaracinus amylolyticus]UJR85321.1 Hypothetical protein I5071_74010 [Sandaracinus amylolyticus]
MSPSQWAATFAALVVLSGCVSSREREDERASAWVDAYLDAMCAFHARCETDFAGFAERHQSACHEEGYAYLRRAAARAGRTTRLDDDIASGCLAAIDAASCRVAPQTLVPALIACQRPFVGLVEVAGACDPTLGVTMASECAPGLYCRSLDGACGGACEALPRRGESCSAARACADGATCVVEDEGLRCRAWSLGAGEACDVGDRCALVDGIAHACVEGRCAPVPVVAVGEACAMGVARCEDDAWCADGICTARGALGDACGPVQPCVEGLRCDTDSAPPRCAPLGVAGDRCAGNHECAAEAPFCADSDGDGVEHCSVTADGSWCRVGPAGDYPFHAFDSCPETHVCAIAGEIYSHRCYPIAARGEACDDTRPCENGSRCVGARCIAIALPGEACGAEVACPLTHACVDGRCAALPAIGEACTDACFEGVCRDGVCVRRAAGEACDGMRTGWYRDCEGVCGGDVCVDLLDVGATCGWGLGGCDAELVCVPTSHDAGVCVARCE